MSEVSQEWIEALKVITSAGEAAAAVSPRTSRSVKSRGDLVQVLAKDPAWLGELVVGPDLATAKQALKQSVPGTRRVVLPPRGEVSPEGAMLLALREVSSFSSLADLEASGVEFGRLVASCLNWHGEKRATKNVVKALATVFEATGLVDGVTVSRFAQGVEVLSFATVVAPLLEPDRLARLISVAASTPTAYQPMSDPRRVFEHLQSLLGRYSEERRERLLADLWSVSHERRWWDLKAKKTLNDPYGYGPHGHHPYDRDRHDANVVQRRRDRAAEAAQLRLDNLEKSKEFWNDGVLTLPAEAASLDWWIDPIQSNLSVTPVSANGKMIEFMLTEFGQPFFEALSQQAALIPNLEKYQVAHDAANEGRRKGSPLFGYHTFFRDLNFAITGDDTELKAFRESNAYGVVDRSGVHPFFWRFMTGKTFDTAVETYKPSTGAIYQFGEKRAHERRIKELKAQLPHLSDEKKGRLFEIMGTSSVLKIALAAVGACRRDQHSDLLRSRSGLSKKQRTEVLQGPHTTSEDIVFMMEKVLEGDVQGPSAAVFLGRYAHLVDFDTLVKVYQGFTPTRRAAFFSCVRSESLEGLLAGGMESDESILAEALVRRTALPAEDLTLKGPEGLMSRIRSWKPAQAVLEAIAAQPGITAGVSGEAVAQVIKAACDKSMAALFLKAAERREIVVGVEAWVAAAAQGASLGGSAALDAAAGQGLLDRESLEGLMKSGDPDALVTAAHDPSLAPSERPGNVVAQLADRLVSETVDVDEWPAKPTAWSALVPKAGTKRYPFPVEVFALDGTMLPGVEKSEVKIVKRPLELHQNAQHMGNCTYGYDHQLQNGSTFIGYVKTGKGEFNFAASRRNRRWQVGEVNSRFNRGGVPANVQEGVGLLVASLNS